MPMKKLLELFAKLRVWGIPGIADFVTKKIHWRRMAHEFRRLSRLDEGAIREHLSTPFAYEEVPSRIGREQLTVPVCGIMSVCRMRC